MTPRSDTTAGAAGGGRRARPRTLVTYCRSIRRVIADRIAVDRRALAALRISVGCLLLADLAIRSRDLVAHYTDAGVLPRALLHEQYGGLASLAFAHGLSGAAWVQGLLFVLAGVAALAMILGYRSRLATAVSFLLLVSLHARNPVLLNAGDSLLRRLLLWGLFLPLGSRWSVDALRGGRGSGPVAGVATAALLLQVVIIYVVNGVIKLRGGAWLSGTAIRLVFELDHLTVYLGDRLAEFPMLLQGLGWLWLGLLVASPLLVVLRGRPRAVLAGLFAAMHLGMFLTMRLGLFPLVSIAALLAFLPPRVWDVASARLGPGLERVADPGRWLPRLDRTLPRRPRTVLPAGYRQPAARGVQVFVALLLAFVLIWNAAALGYVASPPGVSAVADPGDRRWDMFAPNPRTNDGWFVVAGELETGEDVDAFLGGPVTYERPPELARTFPSHRWFVYLLELPGHGAEPLRAGFAEYLCRRWNAGHSDRLEAVTVYWLHEPARLDGRTTVERIDLGRYECGTG